MALMAILDSIDTLPEDVKKEYVEKDGKFHLDVTPVDGHALENVTGLKSSLSAVRKEVADKQKKLELFTDFDIEAGKKAIERVAVLEDLKPDEQLEEKYKLRESQLVSKHVKEVAVQSKKITGLTSQLTDHLVTAAAATSLSKHTLQEHGAALLMPHILHQTRIVELDDGRMVARIVGADGSERLSQKSGSLDPMEMDELVETMKVDPMFQSMFAGTGASGSGKKTDPKGSRGADTDKKSSPVDPTLSAAERLRQHFAAAKDE